MDLFKLSYSHVNVRLGPLAVGFLSDRLTPSIGPTGVRYALLVVVASNLWASVHFFLAARTLLRDLEAKNAPEPAS